MTKKTVELIHFFKKDLVQHLGFGGFVYLIVFCFFAILVWYQGRVELLETLDYRRQAFWRIAGEALLYTFLLGVPVYFNLLFVYKGRIQEFIQQRIFTEAQIKGGGFYIFLFFSLITAILFGVLFTPVFQGPLFDIIHPMWFENVLVILLMILCSTGISFSKEVIETNREKERLERREAIRRQKEAEQQLGFLKKQIRPHFLFNTMANLQVLAKQKSDRLPDLMGQLSNLLRHLIYRTNEKLVPLDQELEFIKSYVGLQELSLGKKTKLDLEIVKNEDKNSLIAPMILLLFVENCFKHYNKSEAGEKFIRIRIAENEEYLVLNTENTFKPYARNEDNYQNPISGLGQKSAIENLNLLYGDQYVLETRAGENVYSVNLQIPLQ